MYDLKTISERVKEVRDTHGEKYLCYISPDLGGGRHEAFVVGNDIHSDYSGKKHILRDPGVHWESTSMAPDWFFVPMLQEDFPEEDIERAIEFINS